MKKLLCVLMFGMVFGQAELTTKIYPLTMSWDVNAEEFNFDLQSITGYDLDNALVNFYSINEYYIYGGEAEFEVYLSNEGYQDKFALTRFQYGVLLNDDNGGGENSSFIYSESLDYTIRVLQGYQTPGFATLNFAITAEFPQEEPEYAMAGGLQRVIDVTIEEYGTKSLSELFPEYDLQWALINIVSCSNDKCILRAADGESEHVIKYLQGNYIYSSTEQTIASFYANSDTEIRFVSYTPGMVTMKLLVTADFPDDDTGDTDGDGWDDLSYEAGADSVVQGDMNGDGAYNVLDIVALAYCVLAEDCEA